MAEKDEKPPFKEKVEVYKSKSGKEKIYIEGQGKVLQEQEDAKLAAENKTADMMLKGATIVASAVAGPVGPVIAPVIAATRVGIRKANNMFDRSKKGERPSIEEDVADPFADIEQKASEATIASNISEAVGEFVEEVVDEIAPCSSDVAKGAGIATEIATDGGISVAADYVEEEIDSAARSEGRRYVESSGLSKKSPQDIIKEKTEEKSGKADKVNRSRFM